MPINVRNRKRELRIWTSNLNRMESVLRKSTKIAIARFYREASKPDMYGVAAEDLRERLIRIFEAHYKRTAMLFGGRVLNEANSKGLVQLETKLSIRDFVASLTAFIEARALFASNIVADTVRERVVRILSASAGDGLSERETAKRIVESGAVDSASRAFTIARTETHSAAIHAQREAIETLDINIATHEWLAASDERTRETHAEANGQIQPIGQPFEVGGFQMNNPGDSSLGAPAGEVINCRCVELFET